MDNDHNGTPAITTQVVEAASLDALLPPVYSHLWQVASHLLRGEQAGHTLTATALVNEGYLHLRDRATAWAGTTHVVNAMTLRMRRILIECGRRKRSLKHGGDGCRRARRQPLDAVDACTNPPHSDEHLALTEALQSLEARAPHIAEVVKARFFKGLTGDQTAAILDISPRTADFRWRYGRALLARELGCL